MQSYDPTSDLESTFDVRAREARRLAGRVEYETKHGEHNHRMNRDEATLTIVALRFLAGTLSGEDAACRVRALLDASQPKETVGV